MSLFADPTEHAANPPATWEVVKVWDGLWRLTTATGATLDTFTTRRGALAERQDGHLVRQYDQENRWYAGEPVRGWRPWADIAAERERLAVRAAARAARAVSVLTVTRHTDGQVLHTGTDLPQALAVLDAAGHAAATLTAAPVPVAPVEPVAPPTVLAGAVEPLLPIEWPTPARVVGRGRTATVDLDALALF